MIESSEKATISIAETKTLPELFLRSLTEFNLSDALNYKKDGEWKIISSAEMVATSRGYSTWAIFAGIEKW